MDLAGTDQGTVVQTEDDPWAAAFAALESIDKEGAPQGADGGQPDNQKHPGAQVPDGSAGPAADAHEGGHGDGSEGQPGDLGGDRGEAGGQDGDPDVYGLQDAGEGSLGVDEAYIEEYRESLVDDIRDRAIDDVAREFIKRGIRHRDGRLGASIDDPDIMKRDSDGVPVFYNPETGREFTGDNPRRQAQEWVDDYNRELAEAFNGACERYEQALVQQEAPMMAVLEFAPKYEALDPIRQGMLENLIEDYEVTDSDGNLVGYSVDLDKALAIVDRQVAMIQGYARERGASAGTPGQVQTSPALDMRNSAGAVQSERRAPQSLAEAMEALQDDLLSKAKR